MEDPNSFRFENRVSRNGKLCYVRDLKLGNNFEHNNKRYRLTTKRATLGECKGGVRVRRYGYWYVVVPHGKLNLLFPLENQEDPFSAMQEKAQGDFDQDIELEILTFRELEAA
jgi:hypothetical protein